MDNVIDIEEYKRIRELKTELMNEEIDINEVDLDDLTIINGMIERDIKNREAHVEELRRENEELEVKIKILKGEY